MNKIISIIGLGALLTAGSVFASTILTQTPQGNYANNVLNGSRWTQMTGYLTAQHTITSTADFSSLSELNAYDAVWVDQELGEVLSAAEISALTSYASAGGKLVLVGENNSWDAWNASIISIVGGGYLGGCFSDIGTAISSHPLASGVGSIKNVCGSQLTNTGSPDILFSNNLADVYSVGTGEVLVFLDSNWNDDDNIITNDHAVFAQNIATWIGSGQPVETFSVAASVVGGNGSVSCDPISVSAGESSTCTAVPDQGYQVSGWTGACAAAGTSTVCQLANIQADQSSTVSFEVIPVVTFNVSAAVAGSNGSVSCNPTSVAAGESSTCTAVPDPGYQVSGWTGACAAAGTSTVCQLTGILSDQSSTVSFGAIPAAPTPPSAVPVPTMTRFGLVLLTMLMLALAAVRYRW